MSNNCQRKMRKNLDVMRNSTFVQLILFGLLFGLFGYSILAASRNLRAYSVATIETNNMVSVWLLALAIAVSVFTMIFTRSSVDLYRRSLRMVAMEIVNIILFAAIFVYFIIVKAWALLFVIVFPVVHSVGLYDNVRLLLEEAKKREGADSSLR